MTCVVPRWRSLTAVLAIVLAAAGLAAPASAVTRGTFDGNNHPYVGYEDNVVSACSGTLLSPTVMLTRRTASATARPASAPTPRPAPRWCGSPSTRTWPTRRPRSAPGTSARYYFDPQFAIGAGGGLPGFDTHDVAIIVFGEPGCHTPDRPRQHLRLRPGPGVGDARPVRRAARSWTWSTRSPWTRRWTWSGTACRTSSTAAARATRTARRRPATSATRFFAADHPGGQQQHASATSSSSCTRTRAAPASATPAARTCSAAPTSFSAVNSFVANAICSGNTYSYRVDTAEALAWITTTAAAHGGVL